MLHLADLLEANEGLDYLDITRTSIDMVGAATICAAIRRNSTVQTLRMGDIAQFQVVESELPSHIGRMLQFNSTLQILDISKIQLRDEGMEIITDDLLKFNRSLTSLTISRCDLTSRNVLYDVHCMRNDRFTSTVTRSPVRGQKPSGNFSVKAQRLPS